MNKEDYGCSLIRPTVLWSQKLSLVGELSAIMLFMKPTQRFNGCVCVWGSEPACTTVSHVVSDRDFGRPTFKVRKWSLHMVGQMYCRGRGLLATCWLNLCSLATAIKQSDWSDQSSLFFVPCSLPTNAVFVLLNYVNDLQVLQNGICYRYF